MIIYFQDFYLSSGINDSFVLRSCLTSSSSVHCPLFFDHLVTWEISLETAATARLTWLRIHNFTSSRVLNWFWVIDCVPFSSGLGEQRQRWMGLGRGGGLLNRWWRRSLWWPLLCSSSACLAWPLFLLLFLGEGSPGLLGWEACKACLLCLTPQAWSPVLIWSVTPY